MSIPSVTSGDFVRSPESLETVARCLHQVIDRGNLLAFLCYFEESGDVYVVPPLASAKETEILGILRPGDWKDAPSQVLSRVFLALGLAETDVFQATNFEFIAAESRDEPIGLYAYVEDLRAPGPVDLPDRRVIDLLLREVMRSHELIRSYASAAQENDTLFSTIKRMGIMLLNRVKRPQMLAALLETTIHVAKAEVGVLLVRNDAGELFPDVEMGLPPEVVSGVRFLPEKDSIVERLEGTRRALVIDDVSGPAIYFREPVSVRISALLAVPLFLEGELVGLICLARGEAGLDLSRNQLRSVELIAAIVSLAIENERTTRAAARSLGGDGAGATPPALGLAGLEALLRDLEEGVIVGDPAGRVLVANPAALAHLGLAAKEAQPAAESLEHPALAWFRSLCRQGRPRLEVRVPKGEADAPQVVATFAPLRERGKGEARAPAWMSVLRADVHAAPDRSWVEIAIGVRDHLNKIQLATDLMCERAGPRTAAETAVGPARSAAADAGMEKTIGALRRSLVGLQRICEDLEGLDESEHRWISRACALDEVLHLALDQLAGESPGEKWRAVEIESKAPVVVLGDPWQLQGAFVRILHEIRVRGDRSRALRVAISTRGSASLVRFEFYCQREPEDQPELYFVTARGSHSAPAGYSLSTGMRAATRTISRCGGEVRVERAESAEGIVLVVLLPLAPSLQ